MIKDFFSIPNILSFFRIPLAFLFAVIFVANDYKFSFIHLIISFIIEFTDTIDGMIARRMKQTSDLGKILDPMADSYSRIILFACLTVGNLFPLIALTILMFRDTIVPFIRQQMAIRGVAMAARVSGKIKAITQAFYINSVLIFLLIFPNSFDKSHLKLYSIYGGSIVALVTIWSGYDYFKALLRMPDTAKKS